MKYFSINELCRSEKAGKLGIPNVPGAAEEAALVALVDNVLDPLREAYGHPIRVNSGYRCTPLNKAVGGAATSWHLKGCAADITAGSKSENRVLFEYIRARLPFTELIWENGGQWVHVAYVKGKITKKVKFLYAR